MWFAPSKTSYRFTARCEPKIKFIHIFSFFRRNLNGFLQIFIHTRIDEIILLAISFDTLFSRDNLDFIFFFKLYIFLFSHILFYLSAKKSSTLIEEHLYLSYFQILSTSQIPEF